MRKRLYVRLSKPLEFAYFYPNSKDKPFGWYLAKAAIDKDYEFNKLDVLSALELIEIKERLLNGYF